MDRSTFEKKYRGFSANFTNEILSTTSRGTSFTGYVNEGVVWGGELSDGAKDSMYFMDSVNVRTLGVGNALWIEPYRNYYPRDLTFDTGEPSDNTSNVTFYNTNHVDGVTIRPTQVALGAVASEFGLFHNIRDLLRDKMDELSYALTYRIDTAISAALSAAKESTSSVSYALQLYGGDAYQDAGLTAGDVLTPSLVVSAKVYLQSKYAYYWNSSTLTKSSGTKNPWRSEATDPFVLIIGPQQEGALLNAPQFYKVNEYGNRSVISSGEIGDYMGIRVIMSNNVPQEAAGAAATSGYITSGATYSSTTTLDGKTSASYPAVDITRCFLMKGRAAYTFVWGRTPQFTPWEKPWINMRGITLVCDYAGSLIHEDAIVKLDVADN